MREKKSGKLYSRERELDTVGGQSVEPGGKIHRLNRGALVVGP